MAAEFFSEQNLSFDQVKALTRAMLTVARVDGVHDHEMRMVREFYESCARAGDPRLEEIAKGNFDIETARGLFGTPELGQLFVKTLILLAFADGSYARNEDNLIRDWAKHLGLSSEAVDNLLSATKEFLLAGLAHVQNVDALKEVAKKLETH
jgi:tellurite resistance protein